jgi:DNA-binding MarR family transcriptional regulator
MGRYRSGGTEGGSPARDRLLESLRGLLEAVGSRRGRDTRRAGELSFAQIRLAARLYEQGAMTGIRLAEAAHLSPSAASEMLDGLERAGVVCRATADADRRARVVSLSPEGTRVVEERLRAFRAEVAEALSDCADVELAAAAKVIDRLAGMFARR